LAEQFLVNLRTSGLNRNKPLWSLFFGESEKVAGEEEGRVGAIAWPMSRRVVNLVNDNKRRGGVSPLTWQKSFDQGSCCDDNDLWLSRPPAHFSLDPGFLHPNPDFSSSSRPKCESHNSQWREACFK